MRFTKVVPLGQRRRFHIRLVHGNQVQPRETEITAHLASDDDGGQWWMFTPEEAAKFDRAFAGWTMLWPFGDDLNAMPRKLVRGEVELTWDGQRWSGVPPEDKAVARVMRAAWTGSIPIGRPKLDDDELQEREDELLEAIRSMPEDNPTRDAVASRMGRLTTTGPDHTFRETVRRVGGWRSAVQRAQEVER